MSISSSTRNDVWQQLLDAQRLVQYYQVMAGRHEKRHTAIRFVLLLAGTGSIVGPLLDDVPPFLQAIFGVAVAAAVAWEFVASYARKAAVMHAICMECCAIENELRDLWTDIQLENMKESDIRRTNRKLAARLREVSGWAGQIGVAVDDDLNKEITKAAYDVTEQRYAN